MTIKPVIDAFVRSEYFANWQAENGESGGYSHNPDKRDRYERCQDAAEHGANGSTYREEITDMREAFEDYLRYGRRKPHGRAVNILERVEDAACAYFNALEDWHEQHGQLDCAVG